jgi:hypothetical protein
MQIRSPGGMPGLLYFLNQQGDTFSKAVTLLVM